MNFQMDHIQLPANDLNQSIVFYQSLGFNLTNRADWGYAEMKRNENEKIVLIDSKFFKNVCIGFRSHNLKDLKKSLDEKQYKIIDDSTDVEASPHLSFVDPSGNEIVVSNC